MTRSWIFYLAIIVVSISVSAVCIYYLHGGFEEVHVYEMDGEERVVVGKHFVGRQTHPAIREYFEQSRALVLDSAVQGTLTRVIHKNDTLDDNEVDYFIGIILDGQMAEVPPGYRIRDYSSTKRFAVFLAMKSWVRPSSATIDEMLSAKAEERGYDLSGDIFEIYYHDNSMSVEGWVD